MKKSMITILISSVVIALLNSSQSNTRSTINAVNGDNLLLLILKNLNNSKILC